MLEFIVLGKVPGTDIQLNFTEVLWIAVAFVLFLLISHEIHVRRSLVRRMLTPKSLKKIIKNQPVSA